MNSYLEIATTVLRRHRRPLTGRQILNLAYEADIVSPALHGRTQHKTLQARISEDILLNRERSAFFRTRPGHFFLREFLTDSSIPEEFRQPIAARRRTRDLMKGPALAVATSCVESFVGGDAEATISAETFQRDFAPSCLYVNPREVDSKYALIWAVAAVLRGNQVLCYRIGRYRDDRDAFVNKRSIAFSSLVAEDDTSLFSDSYFGIEESALRAAVTDLDIPVQPTSNLGTALVHRVGPFARAGYGSNTLLAFVTVQCPNWFEPVARRLSLNDVSWLDLTSPPNNIDDFDPWSRRFLDIIYNSKERGWLTLDGDTAISSERAPVY